VTRAVFVFDEGPGAGLGHRRRMEALADAFEGHGHHCELWANAPEAVAPIVVVDSYRQRADDPSRFNAQVVVAIDDLRRDLCVDVLVDPSPGADPGVHRAAEFVLAGGKYALVRAPMEAHGSRRDDVRCILVTTGAADTHGHGATMAGAIARVAGPDVIVRLVLGPWGARDIPAGVEAVDAPSGLAAELDAADLVVTAGGVTLLESLARGRPTVAVETAANQSVAVRALTNGGAAVHSDVDGIAVVVGDLLGDADRRRDLSRAGKETIDGQGPARVAAEVARVAAARHRAHA